jgi:hypothetical protein
LIFLALILINEGTGLQSRDTKQGSNEDIQNITTSNHNINIKARLPHKNGNFSHVRDSNQGRLTDTGDFPPVLGQLQVVLRSSEEYFRSQLQSNSELYGTINMCSL